MIILVYLSGLISGAGLTCMWILYAKRQREDRCIALPSATVAKVVGYGRPKLKRTKLGAGSAEAGVEIQK